MTTSELIIQEMEAMFDEKQAGHLARFFKTGKGEYGEGDRFLGIKVPETRLIVKKYRDKTILKDVENLLNSPWHEIRLAGFLLLQEIYKKEVKAKRNIEGLKLVNFYLENLGKGNNWDLVDLISPKILGDWIAKNPESIDIVYGLAEKEGCLWHQRVAIVSTFTLIKSGRFDVTFLLAERFLTHSHDLIHKATGWMLREIGKRGGEPKLIGFLEKHKNSMPRTMLRYAIEKFPEEKRKYFMCKQ